MHINLMPKERPETPGRLRNAKRAAHKLATYHLKNEGLVYFRFMGRRYPI